DCDSSKSGASTPRCEPSCGLAITKPTTTGASTVGCTVSGWTIAGPWHCVDACAPNAAIDSNTTISPRISTTPGSRIGRSLAVRGDATRPERATARRWTQKRKPGVSRASLVCSFRVRSVLDVQLGATVDLALAARQRLHGRLQRTALAVTHRTTQAAGVDAVAGHVVVHRRSATLRQALVVGFRT